MRYILLTIEQQTHLTLLYKSSQDHRERQRAHVLLLSSRQYSIEDLAVLFDLDRDTISRWMNRWEEWLTLTGVQKSLDLQDRHRTGRPATLSPDQKKA